MTDRVVIPRLASGVPGLDDVLGGGIPEFSLNLIAGGPGSGKRRSGTSHVRPGHSATEGSLLQHRRRAAHDSSQRMTRMITELRDFTRARLGGGLPLFVKPARRRAMLPARPSGG